MTTGAEQVDTEAKGRSRVSSAHRVVRIDCMYIVFSKIQLVVYCQCCVLIGWASTKLYVIAP